jgi:hypothetical protein
MRDKNWPNKLYHYVESVKDTPFAWGVFDCAVFAAGAVETITGEDVFAPVAGYDSAHGANEMLAENGCEHVFGYVDKLFDRAPTLTARNGDLAACGFGLGVIYGGVALVPGDDGLLSFPLDQVAHCWRVGDE